MKIVSRMVFAQIMKSSLFVLLTLVALFAFFDLIGQSGNIGTSYSMGQAFRLAALILPTRCYEVLPIAVMLGSIFTLSRLASTSQFTVLRVSGIGPWRFCGMLLMPGLVLVICAYLLGNLVAPPAQRLAKEFKLDISGSAFTGKELDSGIWVRDVQRNEAGEPKKISFVNVQRLRPGEAAYDWVIYVFDRPDHLTSIVTAKSGTYSEQDGWVLHDVVEETVPTLPKESREQTQERVERKVMKSMVWGKSLDGNIFGLLMIKPEDMSLQELHYYIEYLKENGQTYKRFDTAFWSKAFYPLAILVMLLRYGDHDFLRHHDRYLLLCAEQSVRVYERVRQCAVYYFGNPALAHDDARCRYCHVVRGAKVLNIETAQQKRRFGAFTVAGD